MKNLGQVLAFNLKRLGKLPQNIISFFIRLTMPVKKGTVMCWSYKFQQYSCNPRYLTEYLLENDPSYEIFWVFRKKTDIGNIDRRIRCVRFRSWKYLVLVNTAEFLITNCRTDPYDIYWKKRQGQKYMMLWHGGVALKKIEKDAEDKLSYSYLRRAANDSKVCDLMISGCGAQSRLIKNSFWYEGEILEKGIPRNDIFFKKESHAGIREEIYRRYGIPKESRLVLYAPTFRTNRSLKPYRVDWDSLIPDLKKLLNCESVTILLRLHPNLIGKDTSSLLKSSSVTDVTRYHDMQELLCISDLLITDYSSSMFDFPMTGGPCFLYATDVEEYDRGYYFDYYSLPFPISRSQEELAEQIRNFDKITYDIRVRKFYDENIQLNENGNSSGSIAGWMNAHSL